MKPPEFSVRNRSKNPLLDWFFRQFHVDQPKPAGTPANRAYRHLLYVVRQARILAVLAPLFAVTMALAGAAVPLLIGIVIDHFVVPDNRDFGAGHLNFILLICLVFGVPLVVETLHKAVNLLLIYPNLGTLMKRHTHQHLQSQSWSFFQNELTGSIGTKVETLSNASGDLYVEATDYGVYVVVLAVASLAVTGASALLRRAPS